MKRIMHWLLPKEEKLLELLAELSNKCLEMANELKNFINEYAAFERSERKARVQLLKNIELQGDEISHRTIEGLNKTFRAPLDKGDMIQITVMLDDIIDLLNAAASRLVLLSIERIDVHITNMADICFASVAEVNKSILQLRNLKQLKEHCAKIYSLEKEADTIYQEALSELFHFYKNSIDIIKYKEIYELLEATADKCKDVASLLESIAARHS